MALQNKSSICTDCCHDRHKVIDGTGTYSSVDNVTGWGVPNAETGDVTSSLLHVTDPNGNTEIFTATSLVGSFMYVTPGVTLNSAGDINTLGWADGIWEFQWVVIAGGVTYTHTNLSGSTCIVAACVADKLANVDAGCGCDGRDSDAAMKASLYLSGLKAAWGCGKYDKAGKILERLQEICSNDCKDC